MAVQSSDIVVYGSALMPEDDATTNIGGGIDRTTKITFTDIAATGTVGVYSSAAGDTSQTITITGRDATGAIVSETLTLNGTTKVTGTQQFERILKAVLSAAATGTVTLEDNAATPAAIMTFEPGILTVRRPFYDASANVAGGAVRRFYDKVFVANENAVSALLNAKIEELSDPTAKIAFALEAAQNGTDTNGAGNTRLVAPAGYTFDSAAKAVPGTDLGPGSAIGVWLELTLQPGDAATKTSYQIRVSGSTA